VGLRTGGRKRNPGQGKRVVLANRRSRVAFACWYREIGELTIPDTAPGFFIFMVVSVVISWIVFFAIRLSGAPARVYALLENEKNNLQAELEQLRANRAILTISGPHIFKDKNYQSKLRWRIKVHNSGPAPADNVQMKLIHGNLEPEHATWGADYPYPIARVAAKGATEHKINPNAYENYEIICGWKSEGGPFFTTLDTKNDRNQIQIHPKERWEFLYEVTASNAKPLSFTLQIFIEADEVRVIMVNLDAFSTP
jgi:hypothetical protein